MHLIIWLQFIMCKVHASVNNIIYSLISNIIIIIAQESRASCFYHYTHFPISRNPSITFIFFGPEKDWVLLASLRSGLPGWTSRPNVNPKQTLNTDVRTKYTIVLTATLPFLLMSKLAAPEIMYSIVVIVRYLREIKKNLLYTFFSFKS